MAVTMERKGDFMLEKFTNGANVVLSTLTYIVVLVIGGCFLVVALPFRLVFALLWFVLTGQWSFKETSLYNDDKRKLKKELKEDTNPWHLK